MKKRIEEDEDRYTEGNRMENNMYMNKGEKKKLDKTEEKEGNMKEGRRENMKEERGEEG